MIDKYFTKTVVCPVLTVNEIKYYLNSGISSLEVIINFRKNSRGDNVPVGIMCPKYDGKICNCSKTECVYEKFQYFNGTKSDKDEEPDKLSL
jgi:hypothetical protein